MQEHNIIISVDEYRELVEKAAQIDAVERVTRKNEYISTDLIKAILGIETKEGEEVGTV